LDSDDSGYISAENLAELLGSDFPRDEIDEILRESNLSRSNQVSYTEFLALWEQKHEEDRSEALRMLGDQPNTYSSQSMLSASSVSNYSLSSGGPKGCDGIGMSLSIDSAEELDAAKARASFLKSKHNQESKHIMGFGETFIEIASDNIVQPLPLLGDERLDEKNEGFHL
jgi:hypothetical protein